MYDSTHRELSWMRGKKKSLKILKECLPKDFVLQMNVMVEFRAVLSLSVLSLSC